jgi:hypothetical protein
MGFLMTRHINALQQWALLPTGLQIEVVCRCVMAPTDDGMDLNLLSLNQIFSSEPFRAGGVFLSLKSRYSRSTSKSGVLIVPSETQTQAPDDRLSSFVPLLQRQSYSISVSCCDRRLNDSGEIAKTERSEPRSIELAAGSKRSVSKM